MVPQDLFRRFIDKQVRILTHYLIECTSDWGYDFNRTEDDWTPIKKRLLAFFGTASLLEPGVSTVCTEQSAGGTGESADHSVGRRLLDTGKRRESVLEMHCYWSLKSHIG